MVFVTSLKLPADAKAQHGIRPFVFTNLKAGYRPLQTAIDFILDNARKVTG